MIRTALYAPLLATGLLFAAPAAAQDDQQAEFQAKYEEKLKKDFVAHGGWITDYDEARALAKKENKLIFVYFTRSYSP